MMLSAWFGAFFYQPTMLTSFYNSDGFFDGYFDHYFKVHIFREDHKFLWNLHCRFVLCTVTVKSTVNISQNFVAFKIVKLLKNLIILTFTSRIWAWWGISKHRTSNHRATNYRAINRRASNNKYFRHRAFNYRWG